MTADKTASFLSVAGLNPGTGYYFVVQTRTEPHLNNQNIVDSEYSVEVSAETLPDIVIISGTITSAGSGLPGVALTLSNGGGTEVTDVNGNYSVTVNYGWTGVITPSKGYYLFNPANRDYPLVTSNINNQDYTASIPLSISIHASRQNDGAFLTSNDLGIITLTVENNRSIPDIRFVIYRKTPTSGYQPIKEFTDAELQSGIYIYYDKYIDKDITYTYRVTAYDLAGNIIVVSNEKNI